jgi:hypothetical protein
MKLNKIRRRSKSLEGSRATQGQKPRGPLGLAYNYPPDAISTSAGSNPAPVKPKHRQFMGMRRDGLDGIETDPTTDVVY